MAQELQGLLERIQEEGVKKADGEKERIISEAKAEAAKILNNAKTEAANITKKAEDDATALEARAKAAIQQASRDIILTLKDDLKKRLEKIIKTSLAETMTADFMGKIILAMVKDQKPSLELCVSAQDADKMAQLCQSGIAADLKKNPEISIGNDFSAGLKIGFEGDDVFFDFTDDALADLICSFIGPRLAALLEPGKDK
ncbi:MAG: hypothetical protein JXR78_17940 [Victivallales bacterium]|nr:hypothetical protein [Victivallales bacterium]